MTIMTAAEFHSRSRKFFSTGRSPLVRDVENLIRHYHQSADNPRRQLKIAVLLYIWCRQYIHAGGTRGGVAELTVQVREALPKMEMTLKLAHQGARWKGGQMKVPASAQGKSMGEGYRMEPFLPGKGTVGGLQLQHQVKRINTPALRALFEDDIELKLQNAAVKTGQSYTMKDVVHQAELAMATASITEFLDVYCSYTRTQAYAERGDFEYCAKDQRQNYRVHIDPANGRFYKDELYTAPYSTDVGTTQKDWAMFAADVGCRLFVKPQRDVADGRFNHSSFLSGKPVMCAGAIEIDPAGRLRSISNESGHYRPTPGDLAYLLLVLHHHFRVNLTGVTAVVSSAQGKQTMNATVCANRFANHPRSQIADL
jgi:hypothetical protein